MWYQYTLVLRARPRGFHLITAEMIVGLPVWCQVPVELLHLLLQHTSASLTLNESCDPSVRYDMDGYFSRTAADATPYAHGDEGADEMPAHIVSSLLGVSLTVCQGAGVAA